FILCNCEYLTMSKVDALAKRKDEEKHESTLRSTRYQWFIVIFMGLVGFLDNNLNLMEGQVIPFIIGEYGIDKEFFGLWQGIFGIATFSVFILSWFTDAYGRKKGTLVLLLLMGVPAFLMILLTPNIWTFYIIYTILITGTVSNLWEIPVSEESPAKKRAIYGGVATLISLVPIAAIIGDDIADALGWRWSYGIFFFVMIGLLLMLYFMKEPQRWVDAKAERGHEFLKFKQALKSFNKKDWTYAAMSFVVYGIWAIGLKVGNSWARQYYEETSPTVWAPQWNTIILVAGLMLLLGAIVSGIVMERVSRKVTLIFSTIGSSIGFIFLGLTGHPVFLWIAYFAMTVLFTWIMVYFTEVFRTEIRTTGMGIASLGTRISYVFGPLIAAAMFATLNWTMFWVIPGILLLIPLFILFLKPYETKGKTLEEIQEER
ncbi:MAG: MFS transporter, partial [Candidatus Hermodarchaeota archaeon]